MAEIIARPTQLLFYNNSNANKFAQGLIDGDPSGQSSNVTGSSLSAMNFILGGFDFSALPNGSTITDLSVTFVFHESKGAGFKANCIKDATSVSTYTDLGDGTKTVALSSYPMKDNEPETVSFPNAASAISADFLKNNGLQVRVNRAAGSGYAYCYSVDLYATVTYTEAFQINGISSPNEGGSVTGGGYFQSGQTVTLTATPNTGYKFKQWSDGNTANPRTVTVTANATYTAQFEKLTYNITATVSPADGGTVSGVGVYSHGDTATLTATPATGFRFVQWSDGVTNPTRTLTVTSAASFTAYFEKSATSNVYCGTSKQAVYGGAKRQAVYIGTKKIT